MSISLHGDSDYQLELTLFNNWIKIAVVKEIGPETPVDCFWLGVGMTEAEALYHRLGALLEDYSRAQGVVSRGGHPDQHSEASKANVPGPEVRSRIVRTTK